MSGQTIEITVSPTGQTKIQTRGFTGAACQQASRFLEQALGQRLSQQLTAEFHQTQPEQTSLRTENHQ